MAYRKASCYNHVQEIADVEWTVVHNLNCVPVVDTFVEVDGKVTKIIPKAVDTVDMNTLKVTFSRAQSGRARVV